MRKVIILLTAMLLVLSASSVYAGKNDAGEVLGDSLYHDLKYDFDMVIQDGWKVAKMKKDKDICRLMVAKNNPVIPSKYQDSPHLYTVPKLTLLADTVEAPVDQLEQQLRDRKGKAKIIKQAVKDFGLLTFNPYRPDFKLSVNVKYGDYKGIMIPTRLQMDANDFRGGAIYILQNNKITLVIEIMAELESYGFAEKDLTAMVKSIGIPPSPPESIKIETGE